MNPSVSFEEACCGEANVENHQSKEAVVSQTVAHGKGCGVETIGREEIRSRENLATAGSTAVSLTGACS